MKQGTQKSAMFKAENPHIKEDNLFNPNQFSHMLECKLGKGQQSGDDQSSSPQNSGNNNNNHSSQNNTSRMFGNGSHKFTLSSINSCIEQNSNNNINQNMIGGGNSNGISSSASNSNGFQFKGTNKRSISKYAQSILAAKQIQDQSDDPESSNHKNNSKTTAINSRNSISNFDDPFVDNWKDNTSCSLNFLQNKNFNGIQTGFSNVKSNIQSSQINSNHNIKNGLHFDNSLNNFSSSLFLGNSNINNNVGNNNNNTNTISDLNANNSNNTITANKILKSLQLNNPDFSSPIYAQNSFNQFNNNNNTNSSQSNAKSSSNNTKNNITFGGNLNSNNTQKWNGYSTPKISLSSNLHQQLPHSINNQEDEEGDLFNNESLSVLWAKPSDLLSQTQRNLLMSEQNLSIDGNLKQHLNKKLLGESSFHKRNTNSINDNMNISAAFTPSTMSHLNSNANLNNTANFQDDDDKGERSSRGLRNLSLKVKQIVVQRVETSYKEVADQLVEELRSSTMGQMKQEDIQKDEQNIKRRVYDALNVLIASKVIEKKGKVVKSCEKSRLNGRCLQVDNWKNVKLVESERDKKKETLIQKQKTLTEYAAKYIALMNLIERNKKVEQEKLNIQFSQQSVDFLNNQDQVQELSQRMNTIKEQISLKDKILIDTCDPSGNSTQTQQLQQQLQNSNISNHGFKFPLILITVPTPSNDSSKVIVKMSRDQKNGKFFSQSKMIVNADLDVLLQMNMHQVDQQFASKYLDQEFISKYFVENQFFLPHLHQQLQEDNSEEFNNNIINNQNMNQSKQQQQEIIQIEDNNTQEDKDIVLIDQPNIPLKKQVSKNIRSEDSKLSKHQLQQLNDENMIPSNNNQSKKASTKSALSSSKTSTLKSSLKQAKANKKLSKMEKQLENQIELD